ncbi:hypothetical protein FOXG_19502 [Fusarium oxysporum f. sp. lycopersici 4287]|uniref:Uncharacterized protein n=2 Tax=Fusarium oxysporum TaxID=5507 RepID=A0A0J9V2Y8_FUSO4|nr:hypothetical protein FOXG_19502 [Fusarium oxysporum f. sp. lycopersici 4287]EXK46091.1 hypothetical protein FOMG_04307 [Fusarium oxysporum f. sp. melonis 26406]KAJ9426179.1 hypothetical protein QL093DRAFT_2093288 [Fusarium oxysporum]KNB05186.1 hypothetical protein FOXG_19502 [Fusarium oxysporum f. sp. lycopersici 4287]
MSFNSFFCCRCFRRSRVRINSPSEQSEDLERGEPQQENDLQNNEIPEDDDQHDIQHSDTEQDVPQQDSDPKPHIDALSQFPPYDGD